MNINAAVFILTQNTEVRRVYLKTSLYFLFKHFNGEPKYPVVIFHQGDYDSEAQRDILLSVRSSCRSCVSFRALDKEDFEYPSFIDQNKAKRCVATKVTPYWRGESYRKMCRWWLVHVQKYAVGYKYIMRIDDDSIIEEPIPDLFTWMHEKELVYASNIMHLDCSLCCYGMKEFFEKQFPDKLEIIEKLFVKQEFPTRNAQVSSFRSLLSITQDPLPEVSETMTVHAPLMYYNNFFITKTDFWQREDVRKVIRDIDENGSIFYIRWGDAPIQTLICMLMAGQRAVSRAVFKYSKRMQREAFLGDDLQYHCYLPSTYTETTCIMDKKKDTTGSVDKKQDATGIVDKKQDDA